MTDRSEARPSASRLRDSFPELGYGVGDTVRALRAGLPTARADALASALGVSVARVAELLGVSVSALTRAEIGVEWLKRPNWALGGETPLDYADTGPGALEVDHVVGRMEHGTPP